jgi:hypothetical protein
MRFMEVRTPRRDDEAELKLLIIRQQELAAELARKGNEPKAKAARARLLALLNQLDLMQR